MTTLAKSPEVAYFNRDELPDAVTASLSDECDIAVVRGLLKSKRLRKKLHNRVINLSGHHLVPEERDRLGLRIPRLTEARAVIQKWIVDGDKDGSAALVPASLYELQPDTLRCGPIGRHLDLPNVITSASINMCHESEVYAQRLCSSRVSDHATREEAAKIFELDETGMRSYAHLAQGDAMIVGRGTLHRVEADYDRVALLLSCRETAL